MRNIHLMCWSLRTWTSLLAHDVNGQDMIEYALMAGFVAIATAAFVPDLTASFSSVFSKITSVMDASVAGSSGG